jgi:hypothetical protein
MSDIREIWKNQSLSNSTQVVIREKIEDVTGLNCYVGTIGLSGTKVFILELDNDIKLHHNYLKRFVGVEIQVLPAINHSELVIILLENDLSDIFSYFIEDIIHDLIPVNDQNVALIKISSKINYWKRLFSKITGDILTPQQQRGLYGELIFLNDLLDLNVDKSCIVNGWHGPLGANQDFWYNGLAVEVKTSKSNNPSIKISNEYQLDTSDLNNLYVQFYKLNEYQGGSETLHRLINEIRKQLNTDILIQFNEKLEYLGINPETEEEYNSISYSIGFERTYHITDNFPKIVRSNLNDALSAVSYEIEPKLCAEFEIDINLIFNHLTNGNY